MERCHLITVRVDCIFLVFIFSYVVCELDMYDTLKM